MIKVLSFYEFTPLQDLKRIKLLIEEARGSGDIFGTVLIAEEGINATITGPEVEITAFIEKLRTIEGVSIPVVKEAETMDHAFKRFKVRIKKEIVTLGKGPLDVKNSTGKFVRPQDWEKLIQEENTVLIDTRNEYEFSIGSFRGAINPETNSFRDFPDWIEANKQKLEGKKIAMFCTGGIRCEKASSYMIKNGYKEVYQLEGGILKFLEEQESSSSWEGECFVFDERVAVDEHLNKGRYQMCHACRSPITRSDIDSEDYVKGVSCPNCIHKTTPESKARFAERQKQLELNKARQVG